jgi:1-phosphofructokinase family hexose kinase
MILAAGLTPAWQQILEVDSLQWGAVNRARAAHWCASGKVLNAGRALHSLGADSRTLCVLGGNTGRNMADEFASGGAAARWIETAAPTRVCTTILNQATSETTELVENAAPLTEQELNAFKQAFREESAAADVVILTGSLPQGTPTDYCRRLLSSVTCRVILDIRGPELISVLQLRPFLVKPNRHELAATLGRSIDTKADLLAAMRELNRRGAEWVVVTNGPDEVLASSEEDTFGLQPPTVATVNPIGCGDCLAAGLAVGLVEGRSIEVALRFGMASAAHNAEQLLPSRLDRRRVHILECLIQRAH